METVQGVYDGQVVRLTEAARARPNTRVLVTFLDDVAQPSPFKPTRLQDVAGSLPYGGPAKTLEDMQAAVRRHAEERSR